MKRHIPHNHYIQATFTHANTTSVSQYTVGILQSLIANPACTEVIDLETGDIYVWVSQSGERRVSWQGAICARNNRHVR